MMPKNMYTAMSKPSEFFSCERILIILIFMGYMLHHMLRINMSLAIVDMVVDNSTDVTEIQRFDWNERQKNDILGCFFWGYTIASLISGHWSEICGTRVIAGYGIVLATICTLLTPAGSYVGYYYLFVLRIGVGFGLGMQWSSIMPLATRWVAPTHISKFMSTILGSQIGAAVTVIFSGHLIKSCGWPSVFYVTGIIAVIWCLLWFYNVYDSPRQHPRISEDERERLEENVKYQLNKVRVRKPWVKILTSRPVWAITLAYTGVMLNVNSAVNYIPMYLDQVLNYDISENGLLSSLPFIATYISSALSSYFADKWNSTEYFPLLVVRKLFTIGALLVSALALIIQSVWGYNHFVSVIMFIIWQSSTGCHTAGCIPNIVDISPNYAGTIHGLTTGLGGLMGYLSTKIVALLINNEENFNQWRLFFWILSAVNMVGIGIYFFYSSAEVQEWNKSLLGKAEECENETELRNIIEK